MRQKCFGLKKLGEKYLGTKNLDKHYFEKYRPKKFRYKKFGSAPPPINQNDMIAPVLFSHLSNLIFRNLDSVEYVQLRPNREPRMPSR